ncbi:MAG: J domain-containing protein [Pseudomonadota bacterium]
MATDDHYATLRVSPDADGGVIRAAYRGLMRRYHPDVNGSDSAVARAKAINEAYACLRDPERRALYDRDRVSDRATDSAPARRRGAPYPPPPASPPPDMVWAVTDIGGWRRPRWGRPTWWQALGLVSASIVTVMTFTATSAIPPNEAPGAITYVRLVEPRPPKPNNGRDGERARPAAE